VVAANRPERFRGLGVETAADRFPGCGPLEGLHAGMLASRHPHVFVAACDMPALDAGVIRFLVARLGSADAIVPCWEGDVEPLHAGAHPAAAHEYAWTQHGRGLARGTYHGLKKTAVLAERDPEGFAAFVEKRTPRWARPKAWSRPLDGTNVCSLVAARGDGGRKAKDPPGRDRRARTRLAHPRGHSRHR